MPLSDAANGPAYAVAVIGGATAGAEAAGIFADHGIRTVVFEQNARPYGKIEDGLPRWHVGLRQKEYDTIDSKLTRPAVSYVPTTKVGRDIPLEELIEDWGFHAVVLANGAWRDRPLPIEGADAYVGKGLAYQNPFIYWFNHYNEASYTGEQYEIEDGTIIVGGGLASIDVAKVITLELALRALRQRGIHEELAELEVAGIPKTLSRHGMSWDELGFRGSTIYYRRRTEDMPLVEIPDDASPKVLERIGKSRTRVLEKAMEKYLFKVEPLHAPQALLVENERVVGMKFERTRMQGGKLERSGEVVDVRAPLVISSIGSIPEPLSGVDMRGELYAFDDWDLGRMQRFPTLYSVGNVVTGKGNIVASRKHAKQVGRHMVDCYFEVAKEVRRLAPLSPEQRARLEQNVAREHKRVGYQSYADWIAAHTPSDRV